MEIVSGPGTQSGSEYGPDLVSARSRYVLYHLSVLQSIGFGHRLTIFCEWSLFHLAYLRYELEPLSQNETEVGVVEEIWMQYG